MPTIPNSSEVDRWIADWIATAPAPPTRVPSGRSRPMVVITLPDSENAPVPPRPIPFTTVLRVTNEIEGEPAIGPFNPAVNMMATYSANWWRKDANDAAEEFMIWASSDEALDLLIANGLALYDIDSVERLDDIESGQYEERAHVPFLISYARRRTDQLPTFATKSDRPISITAASSDSAES